MYATEFDLLVAESRRRDLQNEMKAIRLARAAQTTRTAHTGLLGRLVELTSRGAHIQAPHHEVGAAA